METGTIFNIQKFSIHDGPGIRTTVFLKGCPLRCLWCHNPESNQVSSEIFFSSKKCIGCGACISACGHGCHSLEAGFHRYDREACVQCGACAQFCFSGALEKIGDVKSVDDVLTEVLKDRVFYESSGGGLTLSGGEPMAQFAFAKALLKKAREEGLHTCIETCGCAPWEQYREIAEFVDIFLYDYKLTDPELHRQYTGVTNERILENLRKLDAIGAKIILRCPIIPTINDNQAHFEGIANTANSLFNVSEIHIEPYHPLGTSKLDMLGREYPLSHLTSPTREEVAQWTETIAAMTKIPVRKF